MKKQLCCVAVLLFASIASWAQTLSPEVRQYVKVDAPVVALTHVRVIDGTGAPAREDQIIVIRNGKIELVGDSATVAVPSQAKVLELRDYTVIPGLVGMHNHMFYPAGGGVFHQMPYSFPRLYLAGGVTTVRTTGSISPYVDLFLQKQIDRGEVPGPKMHVTGPYLEGTATWVTDSAPLATAEQARAAVNFWADQGVDNFKAYNFISRAVLAATIEAAHKRGLKLTGHLCSVGYREAAALGIDGLEHGLVADTEFYSGKKPDECPAARSAVYELAKMDINSGPVQELIRDLVKHKVAVTSTLPVFELLVPNKAPLQQRVLDAMSADTRNTYLANRVRVAAPRLDPQTGQVIPSPWPGLFKKEMEFEREFVKAGGLLLAGLDPTGIGGVIAGFGDHRQLQLLVEAGFTPVEAIRIATANGAQYLGKLHRTGTISSGKDADLVVIKGNPAKKIEDVENVELVFKDGIGYDSAKLIESARGLVGIR